MVAKRSKTVGADNTARACACCDFEATERVWHLQELCTGLKSEASGLSRENEQLRADLAKKSKRRNRATAAAACQCSLLPDRPAAVAHLERVPASDRLLKPSVPVCRTANNRIALHAQARRGVHTNACDRGDGCEELAVSLARPDL